MFKKTFVALSVGAALGSVNANAVTFDYSPNDWTNEGAELIKDFTGPQVKATLGAQYSAEDLITLSFSQEISDGTFPSIIIFGDTDNDGSLNETNGMRMALVNQGDTEVTYRVIEVKGETANVAGYILNRTGVADDTNTAGVDESDVNWSDPVEFAGADVRAASGVTMTYAAQTGINGLAIDGGSSAVATYTGTPARVVHSSLVTFVPQYAKVVTGKFNGVIDVDVDPSNGIDRTLFAAANNANVNTDELTVTVTNSDAAAAAGHRAYATAVTLTIGGDFSAIVDANPATAALDQTTLAYTYVHNGTTPAAPAAALGPIKFNADMTEASMKVTLAPGTADEQTLGKFTVTYDATKNVCGKDAAGADVLCPINRSAFTQQVDVTYLPAAAATVGIADTTSANAAATTLAKVSSQPAGSAGAFTLNGANISVYGVPLSSSVDNFIYVTNSSTRQGEVSMTATLADGSTVSAADIAVVPAGSIANIGDAVMSSLKDAGGQRATIDLTVNAPACSVVVSAAYKVGGDRLPLETSQTLDGTCP